MDGFLILRSLSLVGRGPLFLRYTKINRLLSPFEIGPAGQLLRAVPMLKEKCELMDLLPGTEALNAKPVHTLIHQFLINRSTN
jgi:hypothetical protein